MHASLECGSLMIIAIMQPYFLPYVGYWRLAAKADLFVILDDVNYSRGWINRNRIKNLKMSKWLTVPLHKTSQNRRICEHRIACEADWRKDHQRRIENVLGGAAHVQEALAVYQEAVASPVDSLAQFLTHSIKMIMETLGVETPLILASSLNTGHGEDRNARIINICSQLGATVYNNLPGGRGIYDPVLFSEAGIGLEFMDFDPSLGGRLGDDQMNEPTSVIQLIATFGSAYVSDAIRNTK